MVVNFRILLAIPITTLMLPVSLVAAPKRTLQRETKEGLHSRVLSRFSIQSVCSHDFLATPSKPINKQPRDEWIKELRDYNSENLQRALKHPDRLMDLITAPKTPFFERYAAALQGGRLFPVRRVPKLLDTLAEIKIERMIHGWSMKQPWAYCTLVWQPRTSKDMVRMKLSPRRRILGREWTVPDKPTDYPRNRREATQAPWPWQVEQALGVLLFSSVPRFDSKKESKEEFQERCDRWYEVCMTMPIDSKDEATKFFLLSRMPAHHMPMDVLARWYKLALDPQMGLYSRIAREMEIRETTPDSSSAPAAAARVFFEDIMKYNSEARKWGSENLRRMIDHMKSHKNRSVRSGFYNDGAVRNMRTQLRKRAFGSRNVPKR